MKSDVHSLHEELFAEYTWKELKFFRYSYEQLKFVGYTRNEKIHIG
jgi:hypothetical protein